MNINHPVNRALILRGMTQVDLGKIINRHASTISAVVNGNRVSRPLKLLIADALDLKMEDAFPAADDVDGKTGGRNKNKKQQQHQQFFHR